MNERSLEARNLTLWKVFWIIPIRLPVSEISSCKGNGNFWSFTTSVLILYSNLSLTYPKLQTSDRFLEILRLSRKKCEPMVDRALIHDHCIAPWKLWILISRRSRYLHSSLRSSRKDSFIICNHDYRELQTRELNYSCIRIYHIYNDM